MGKMCQCGNDERSRYSVPLSIVGGALCLLLGAGITMAGTPEVNTSQIATADHGANPDLDWHEGTGNLFITMPRFETESSWHVYFSNDNGRNWSEKLSLSSKFEIQHKISGIVCGDYFYVTSPSLDEHGAMIRRFNASTGALDNGFGANEVFSEPSVTVRHLELASNRDDRLYLFSILSDGTLKYYWTDQDGGAGSAPWGEVDTGVTDANRYLDVSYVEGHSVFGNFLFAVYRVGQGQVSVFQQSISSNSTTLLDGDSSKTVVRISAYGDTVVVVYEHSFGGGADGVKYMISYDGGDSWNWGTIDDGSAGDAFDADVTLRRGGGIVVAYTGFDNIGGNVFLRTRDYPSGSAWSDPVAVLDNQHQHYRQNEVENLPEGGPGIITFSVPGVIAQFDQTPMIWNNGFELGDTVGWQ